MEAFSLIEAYGLGTGLAVVVVVSVLWILRQQQKAATQTIATENNTKTTVNQLAVENSRRMAGAFTELLKRADMIAQNERRMATLEGQVTFLLNQVDIGTKQELRDQKRIAGLEGELSGLKVRVGQLQEELNRSEQRNLLLQEENTDLRRQAQDVEALRNRVTELESIIQTLKGKATHNE